MTEYDFRDTHNIAEIFEQGKIDREERRAREKFQEAVDSFNRDVLDCFIRRTDSPAEKAMFQYIRDLPDSTERQFEYKLYVFNDGNPLPAGKWREFKTREETEQMHDNVTLKKRIVNTLLVAAWVIFGFAVAPFGIGHLLLGIPAVIVIAIANAVMCNNARKMYSHTYLGSAHPLAQAEKQKCTGWALGAAVGVAGTVVGAATFPKDVAKRMTKK